MQNMLSRISDVTKGLSFAAFLVVFSFSSQANTYKYDLTLVGIPRSVLESDTLKNVRCYLVDDSVTTGKQLEGKTGSVMAEFSYGGKDSVVYNGSGEITGLAYTSVGYNTGGTVSGGSATTKLIASLQPDSEKFTFESFSADKTIDWNYLGDTPTIVNTYAASHLRAYIFADLANGTTLSLDPLSVTASNAISTLGSWATYQEVVPEPTSGLLVLFGLAGLMLKRKKAA